MLPYAHFVCVRVGVHITQHAFGSQGTALGIGIPFYLDWNRFLFCWYVCQTSCTMDIWGYSRLCLSSHRMIEIKVHSGNSNSRPYTWKAGALPTEPSLAPHEHISREWLSSSWEWCFSVIRETFSNLKPLLKKRRTQTHIECCSEQTELPWKHQALTGKHFNKTTHPNETACYDSRCVTVQLLVKTVI